MPRPVGWLAVLLWLLGAAVVSPQPLEKEEEEASYVFRFRGPAQPRVVGERPHGVGQEHGHGGLSEAEFRDAQAAAETFWREHRSSGRAIDADVVIELFRIAKHFSVVHALLDNVISLDESRRIGEVRGEIHQEVLTRLAESGRFGDRLGVNDFGTVGTAKSDIDFTPYAEGMTGPELVRAYLAEFRRRTGGVDAGQMDIVAHSHEAFIPDWRQSQATGDFVQALREGRSLLRSNPEAYFLEGAYHQQVMGRSADGTTLTWIERQGDGPVRRTASNAAADPDFFYFKPDVRRRYAWGGAVGNWHFYHAHASDKVAQAKYLLRSMDDGARLAALGDSQSKRYAAFEKLPPSERARVVGQLYGGRLDAETRAYFQAVMETAAAIRGSRSAGADEHRALIELERQKSPGLGEAALLERARASMDRYGAALLLENNVIASEARLRDWIAPDVKSGEFRTVASDGRVKRITVDQNKVRRLQLSAFFEIRDGIELLPEAEVERIKSENPRFARDIEIVQGVIEKQREMALAPDHLDGPAARQHRLDAGRQILADLNRLDRVAAEGGPVRFFREVGGTAWQRGQQFEDWANRLMLDALPRLASGNDAAVVKRLDDLHRNLQSYNEGILSGRTMVRLDRANSVLEVLKTYVREGELNEEVGKVLLYELLSFLPGVGTVMQVQGGLQGIITLVSTKVIPGYGPLLLTLQVAKGVVELVGLAIFEPLRDDRILFAYQGYLPATSAGLFTTGQSERIDGRVTPILKMADPGGDLPLDQRREGVYKYFHDDITATLARDPNFPYTEHEWPFEWLAKEQEWLTVRIRQHVLDWWNARGLFAGDDEITAFTGKMLGVAEEEFRAALETRLWKDYWQGRQIHFQKEIQRREQEHQELENLMAQVAAVEVGLDNRKGSAASQADFRSNGELIYAHMLDGMPVLQPSMEILVAPRVETLELGEEFADEEVELLPEVNLRATVHASTEEHPHPWSISFAVEQGGEQASFTSGGSRQSLENAVGEATGSWPIRIQATARDADGREIVSRTVRLEVEKVRLDETAEDDEEEGPDEPGGDDPPEEEPPPVDPEVLVGAEAVARAAAQRAAAACGAAEGAAQAALGEAERIASGAGSLEGRAGALLPRLEAAAGGAEGALGAAATADEAGRRLAELRDEAARLRDTACSGARRMAAAGSQEERQRILDEVQAAAGRLETLRDQAPPLLERIRSALTELEAAGRVLAALETEIESLDAALVELQAAAQEVEPSMEEARARIEEARTAIAEIGTRRDQVAGMLPAPAESGGEDPAAEADASAPEEAEASDEGPAEALARIRQAEEEVAGCPERAETLLAEAATALAGARTALATAAERVAEVQAAWDPTLAERLAEASRDVDATLAVVEAFAESIGFRADDAALCAEMAEGSMSLPLTPTVPAVVGLSYPEAESLVARAGLVAVRVAAGPAPSEGQVNQVAGQDPVAGTQVPESSQVTLRTWGDTDRRVDVPPVIGLTTETARSRLAQAGLELVVSPGGEASSPEEEFRITDQAPAAFERVEPGTSVRVVALGRYVRRYPVPSVIGSTLGQAAARVEAAGFAVSSTDAGPAPTGADAYRVISQQPAPGELLEPGQVVSLRAWSEHRDIPPPPPPPPPVPGGGSPEGYCVAFKHYLPVDQSQAGEGRLGQQLRAKRYTADDYRAQDKSLHMEVRPGGVPRGQFPEDRRYALPFSMQGTNPKTGQQMAIDMPLLLEVAGSDDTCEELGRRFPTDGDPIVLDDDGTFSTTTEDGTVVFGGPLEEGWSDEAIDGNLAGLVDLADLFDCFVASAVYRSAAGPQLDSLRRFRDRVLLDSGAGSELVAIYYRHGPRLAAWLKPRPRARRLLEPLLSTVAWVVDGLPQESDLVAGALEPALALVARALRGAGLHSRGPAPWSSFDPLARESAVPWTAVTTPALRDDAGGAHP